MTGGVLLASSAMPGHAMERLQEQADDGKFAGDSLLEGVCDIHLHCRPDRAYLIRQALPEAECFGSFCMNRVHGNKVNPFAARAARRPGIVVCGLRCMSGKMPVLRHRHGSCLWPVGMPLFAVLARDADRNIYERCRCH